jgi:hypothetical protein
VAAGMDAVQATVLAAAPHTLTLVTWPPSGPASVTPASSPGVREACVASVRKACVPARVREACGAAPVRRCRVVARDRTGPAGKRQAD